MSGDLAIRRSLVRRIARRAPGWLRAEDHVDPRDLSASDVLVNSALEYIATPFVPFRGIREGKYGVIKAGTERVRALVSLGRSTVDAALANLDRVGLIRRKWFNPSSLTGTESMAVRSWVFFIDETGKPRDVAGLAKEEGYFPLPLEVARRTDLTPDEMIMFAAYERRCRMRDGHSSVAQGTLAEELGVTVSQVRKWTRSLRRKGYLEITLRRRATSIVHTKIPPLSVRKTRQRVTALTASELPVKAPASYSSYRQRVTSKEALQEAS